MSLGNFAETAILDAIYNAGVFSMTPWVSLHTANPGETGANEVAGGSYARQDGTTKFGGAVDNLVENDQAISFADMPATTVTHVGIWDADAAGNFIKGGPLSTVDAKIFLVDDATNDVLLCPAHGFSNDDRVEVSAEFGGSLPAGLSPTTIYFVVSSQTNDFKVSLTQGGAAVDITTRGIGLVQKVTPKTTNAGDTFQINATQFKSKLF